VIGQVPPRAPRRPDVPGNTVVASAVPTTKVAFTGDPTVGPDPFYTKPPSHFSPKFPRNPVPNPDDIRQLPQVPQLVQDPTQQVQNGQQEQLPPTPETNDSFRRVSGILHSSDGVYAVLETNGVSQTVQPGDDVGGAKVTGIDDNGVTLKTDDNKVLHVPLSDTATAVSK
jgi:hypothetical protein